MQILFVQPAQKGLIQPARAENAPNECEHVPDAVRRRPDLAINLIRLQDVKRPNGCAEAQGRTAKRDEEDEHHRCRDANADVHGQAQRDEENEHANRPDADDASD